MHGFQFQNSVVAGRKQAINKEQGKGYSPKAIKCAEVMTNRCGSASTCCPLSALAGGELCSS